MLVVLVFILIKQDNNHKTVVFGEEQRTFKDAWGDVTAYSERESFPYYIIQKSQEQDCAMAEIAVGEEKADYQFAMEVSEAESGKVLQNREASMCRRFRYASF